MCKYILIALVLVLVILMVVAAVVVQEYGWTGFLILLGSMVVFLYVAKKLSPWLFQYLLQTPMRRMGQALRGGRIVVHSIVAAERPPEFEDDDDDFDDLEGIEDDDDFDEDEMNEPAVHHDWYQVEFSVIPPGPDTSAGIVRNREGWLPSMIAVRYIRPGMRASSFIRPGTGDFSPRDFQLTEHGEVEVWDGENYVTPNETVFGEQRLRLLFGAAREVSEVAIVYAGVTEIGRVTIPRINIEPESTK